MAYTVSQPLRPRRRVYIAGEMEGVGGDQEDKIREVSETTWTWASWRKFSISECFYLSSVNTEPSCSQYVIYVTYLKNVVLYL